jgi:hypothetical protein
LKGRDSMSYKYRAVQNLAELKNEQDNSTEILVSPIRFEGDAPTGFFLKCPKCQVINEYQFSLINNKAINCFQNNCRIIVDIEVIKSKISI